MFLVTVLSLLFHVSRALHSLPDSVSSVLCLTRLLQVAQVDPDASTQSDASTDLDKDDPDGYDTVWEVQPLPHLGTQTTRHSTELSALFTHTHCCLR